MNWSVFSLLPRGRSGFGVAAEAPVARLKAEYRYQLLIKASKRIVLREIVTKLRDYALKQKWPATAMVVDVDPLSLM